MEYTRGMSGQVASRLSREDTDALVALLLACPAVVDETQRALVIDRLPTALCTRVDARGNRTAVVTKLVTLCDGYPDGIAALLAAVRHVEGDSLAMRAVEVWAAERALTTRGPAGPRLVLPSGAVPAEAPLPPGSRMPWPANQLFVGRLTELRALAQAFNLADEPGAAAGPGAGSGARIVAIGQVAAATGMGGMGKTQLASAFAYRYGQYFAGGVFWLSFADPASVPSEVARCGGPGYMNLWTDDATLEQAAQVRRVCDAWRQPVPRLLIFDNCEDEALLATWRPTHGGAHVLLTSRRSAWSRGLGVRELSLNVLARDESVALLHGFRADVAPDDGDLDAIAAELGDLPLALHLAGSFLARYRGALSPADYLGELCDRALLSHPSLEGRGTERSPTGHRLHVGRTFALSLSKLSPRDPIDALARQLLACAGCFAPGEPIARALLLACLADIEAENTEAEDINGTAARPPDALALADALRRLRDLGLIEARADDSVYVLHRLLCAFVDHTLLDPTRAASRAIRAAVERAVLAEANRLNEAGYPAALVAWQPHLRHITDRALTREDTQAASLCNSLAYHLWQRGDYRGAQPYAERALAIRETHLGPEHPDTARSLNNLGALLQAVGELPAARPLYERALAIRETHLGREHPDTALSLNNLGSLLQATGELPAARPLYECALAIWEKLLGPEHPNTAMSLNNLGMLLEAMGELSVARPLYERALAIWETHLGPEHPATAKSLNNLGSLLQAMGELPAVRPLLERALAIRETHLGREHPDTAMSLNNLGLLLKTTGELAAARPLLERALAIVEKHLGREHPDTALSLNNLGLLLKDLGEFPAARPLLERALAIVEKHLGPEHPKTRIARDNVRFLRTLE